MMTTTRKKVILVDDMMSNIDQGRNLLKTFFEVFPAPSAAKLFEILENVIPDLILLDIEMPEMNGYETIKKLKSDPRFADIPVIFVTSKDDESSEMQGFDLGAVDYVTKPFSGPLLLKRITNHLLIIEQRNELLASQAVLQDYSDNLEELVREKTEEIFDLQSAILATVADLVEFRDKYTGGHINRTQRYLKTLVEEMLRSGVHTDEISSWDMDFYLAAAQLHDVGKIAISDMILNKPGKLTFEEFTIMKTHVTEGIEVIERVMSETKEHDFLNHALLFAGTHHEKWDGGGYPVGLRGENIPIEGRIMAIADVYDALISRRPYKEAFSHKDACEIIEDGAGSHFDPDLVRIFVNVKDKFYEIARESGDG